MKTTETQTPSPDCHFAKYHQAPRYSSSKHSCRLHPAATAGVRSKRGLCPRAAMAKTALAANQLGGWNTPASDNPKVDTRIPQTPHFPYLPPPTLVSLVPISNFAYLPPQRNTSF